MEKKYLILSLFILAYLLFIIFPRKKTIAAYCLFLTYDNPGSSHPCPGIFFYQLECYGHFYPDFLGVKVQSTQRIIEKYAF